MYLHIEEPARVREEREYMEHRDAHGPEAMRKKREQGGCGRTKQVDREMPRVQRCEFDRYESVEHLVRSQHGQRDRGHTAFEIGRASCRRKCCGTCRSWLVPDT